MITNQPTNQPTNPLSYVEAIKILSPREVEVLDLIGLGLTSKEIAKKLVISEGTVRTHRGNIRQKIGITGPNGTLKWLWLVKIVSNGY